METLGIIIQAIGEVLVAYTVISVHGKVMHEHKIDRQVFKTMHKERGLAIFAIVLIVAGVVLQLV